MEARKFDKLDRNKAPIEPRPVEGAERPPRSCACRTFDVNQSLQINNTSK